MNYRHRACVQLRWLRLMCIDLCVFLRAIRLVGREKKILQNKSWYDAHSSIQLVII